VGTFGPAGLIMGPVALAITIGLLNVWRWRTTRGRAAEEPPLAPPQATTTIERPVG
jgi:predicted PurR-regulated permease PerM